MGLKKGQCPKNIDSIKGWNKTPDVICKCIICKNKFVLTEASLRRRKTGNKFCSFNCLMESTRNRNGYFSGKKHSEESKRKISEYAYNRKGITRRYNTPQKELIRLFKEGDTLKEICSMTRISEPTLRKILIDYGFTHKDIMIRANKRIGINTKKHRKYQIFPLEDSSIELKIQNFLKNLNIEFFTHQHIDIKHSYQCDILIPSMNLVIECDGNYWHKYPIGKDLDNIRTKELLEKGFKVLRLWESEIRNMEVNDLAIKLEQLQRR